MSMAYGLAGKAPKVEKNSVIPLGRLQQTGDVKDEQIIKIKGVFLSANKSDRGIRQRRPGLGDEASDQTVKLSPGVLGKTDDVKTTIKMLSLFPNTYNSKMTYRKDETGAYRSGMAGV
jgi:hypothetical protein